MMMMPPLPLGRHGYGRRRQSRLRRQIFHRRTLRRMGLPLLAAQLFQRLLPGQLWQALVTLQEHRGP